VRCLRQLLTAAGLPVRHCPSHILPVHVGDAAVCSRLSDRLLAERGHYVQAINYPTVRRGEETLRIAPTPLHSRAMMDEFVTDLLDVWTEEGLPLTTGQCQQECLYCHKPLEFEAAGCRLRAEDPCQTPECPMVFA